MHYLYLIFAAFMFAAAVTAAQMPERGPMGGPPPEAKSACQSSGEGSQCSFTAPHGRVSGSCRSMGQDGRVCVPERGRGGPGGPGGTGDQGRPAGPGGSGEMQPRGARPSALNISATNPTAQASSSRIADTMQGSCFDGRGKIDCPAEGEPFYGQDASFVGGPQAYTDHGNGTVTDHSTGLQWQQEHNRERLGFYAAKRACEQLELAGRDDWRLPNIKSLFSISDWRGVTGSRFFINSRYFELEEPDESILTGDRFRSTHRTSMMGQTWSSTIYAGDHWGRNVEAAFFFNFLDGRIKQAPTNGRYGLFYRCVRGEPYGENLLVDNRNGTISDRKSGLVWQQSDDGKERDWPQLLAYCNDLQLAGKDDWRLPNVKALQSIVDYRNAYPAIDMRFFAQRDSRGWFWSSTTHGDSAGMANYVCFGACTSVDGVDTHGAGAQRSDPKTGEPKSWPAMGGQRDEVRIYNYARCVRDAV